MQISKHAHGGTRVGAGRKKTGRGSITIRINQKLLESLGSNAAVIIREIVERHFELKS